MLGCSLHHFPSQFLSIYYVQEYLVITCLKNENGYWCGPSSICTREKFEQCLVAAQSLIRTLTVWLNQRGPRRRQCKWMIAYSYLWHAQVAQHFWRKLVSTLCLYQFSNKLLPPILNSKNYRKNV